MKRALDIRSGSLDDTSSSDALQFRLSAPVQLLRDTLPQEQHATFGDSIAGATQALLAWVKENNPKQCIKAGRLDKNRHPCGDADCTLGVKKSRTSAPAAGDGDNPHLQVGTAILWGYACGVVATRLPDGSDIVLAERTRPFTERDRSYFFPLLAMVEARLGRKPRLGTDRSPRRESG